MNYRSKKQLYIKIFSLFAIFIICVADVSNVISETTAPLSNEYDFIYDIFDSENCTWKNGAYYAYGKLVIPDNSITWKDFSLSLWDGISELYFNIETTNDEEIEKLVIYDSNNSAIIYEQKNVRRIFNLRLDHYIFSNTKYITVKIVDDDANGYSLRIKKINLKTPRLHYIDILADENLLSTEKIPRAESPYFLEGGMFLPYNPSWKNVRQMNLQGVESGGPLSFGFNLIVPSAPKVTLSWFMASPEVEGEMYFSVYVTILDLSEGEIFHTTLADFTDYKDGIPSIDSVDLNEYRSHEVYLSFSFYWDNNTLLTTQGLYLINLAIDVGTYTDIYEPNQDIDAENYIKNTYPSTIKTVIDTTIDDSGIAQVYDNPVLLIDDTSNPDNYVGYLVDTSEIDYYSDFGNYNLTDYICSDAAYVSDNKLYLNNTNSIDSIQYAFLERDYSNFEIKGSFEIDSFENVISHVKILFRAANSSLPALTYSYVVTITHNPTDKDTVELGKYLNGLYVKIESQTLFTDLEEGRNYNFHINTFDSSIEVGVDNLFVIAVTDDTISHGVIGFQAEHLNLYVGNLEIYKEGDYSVDRITMRALNAGPTDVYVDIYISSLHDITHTFERIGTLRFEHGKGFKREMAPIDPSKLYFKNLLFFTIVSPIHTPFLIDTLSLRGPTQVEEKREAWDYYRKGSSSRVESDTLVFDGDEPGKWEPPEYTNPWLKWPFSVTPEWYNVYSITNWNSLNYTLFQSNNSYLEGNDIYIKDNLNLWHGLTFKTTFNAENDFRVLLDFVQLLPNIQSLVHIDFFSDDSYTDKIMSIGLSTDKCYLTVRGYILWQMSSTSFTSNGQLIITRSEDRIIIENTKVSSTPLYNESVNFLSAFSPLKSISVTFASKDYDISSPLFQVNSLTFQKKDGSSLLYKSVINEGFTNVNDWDYSQIGTGNVSYTIYNGELIIGLLNGIGEYGCSFTRPIVLYDDWELILSLDIYNTLQSLESEGKMSLNVESEGEEIIQLQIYDSLTTSNDLFISLVVNGVEHIYQTQKDSLSGTLLLQRKGSEISLLLQEETSLITLESQTIFSLTDIYNSPMKFDKLELNFVGENNSSSPDFCIDNLVLYEYSPYLPFDFSNSHFVWQDEFDSYSWTTTGINTNSSSMLCSDGYVYPLFGQPLSSSVEFGIKGETIIPTAHGDFAVDLLVDYDGDHKNGKVSFNFFSSSSLIATVTLETLNNFTTFLSLSSQNTSSSLLLPPILNKLYLRLILTGGKFTLFLNYPDIKNLESKLWIHNTFDELNLNKLQFEFLTSDVVYPPLKAKVDFVKIYDSKINSYIKPWNEGYEVINEPFYNLDNWEESGIGYLHTSQGEIYGNTKLTTKFDSLSLNDFYGNKYSQSFEDISSFYIDIVLDFPKIPKSMMSFVLVNNLGVQSGNINISLFTDENNVQHLFFSHGTNLLYSCSEIDTEPYNLYIRLMKDSDNTFKLFTDFIRDIGIETEYGLYKIWGGTIDFLYCNQIDIFQLTKITIDNLDRMAVDDIIINSNIVPDDERYPKLYPTYSNKEYELDTKDLSSVISCPYNSESSETQLKSNSNGIYTDFSLSSISDEWKGRYLYSKVFLRDNFDLLFNINANLEYGKTGKTSLSLNDGSHSTLITLDIETKGTLVSLTLSISKTIVYVSSIETGTSLDYSFLITRRDGILSVGIKSKFDRYIKIYEANGMDYSTNFGQPIDSVYVYQLGKYSTDYTPQRLYLSSLTAYNQFAETVNVDSNARNLDENNFLASYDMYLEKEVRLKINARNNVFFDEEERRFVPLVFAIYLRPIIDGPEFSMDNLIYVGSMTFQSLETEFKTRSLPILDYEGLYEVCIFQVGRKDTELNWLEVVPIDGWAEAEEDYNYNSNIGWTDEFMGYVKDTQAYDVQWGYDYYFSQFTGSMSSWGSENLNIYSYTDWATLEVVDSQNSGKATLYLSPFNVSFYPYLQLKIKASSDFDGVVYLELFDHSYEISLNDLYWSDFHINIFEVAKLSPSYNNTLDHLSLVVSGTGKLFLRNFAIYDITNMEYIEIEGSGVNSVAFIDRSTTLTRIAIIVPPNLQNSYSALIDYLRTTLVTPDISVFTSDQEAEIKYWMNVTLYSQTDTDTLIFLESLPDYLLEPDMLDDETYMDNYLVRWMQSYKKIMWIDTIPFYKIYNVQSQSYSYNDIKTVYDITGLSINGTFNNVDPNYPFEEFASPVSDPSLTYNTGTFYYWNTYTSTGELYHLPSLYYDNWAVNVSNSITRFDTFFSLANVSGVFSDTVCVSNITHTYSNSFVCGSMFANTYDTNIVMNSLSFESIALYLRNNMLYDIQTDTLTGYLKLVGPIKLKSSVSKPDRYAGAFLGVFGDLKIDFEYPYTEVYHGGTPSRIDFASIGGMGEIKYIYITNPTPYTSLFTGYVLTQDYSESNDFNFDWDEGTPSNEIRTLTTDGDTDVWPRWSTTEYFEFQEEYFASAGRDLDSVIGDNFGGVAPVPSTSTWDVEKGYWEWPGSSLRNLEGEAVLRTDNYFGSMILETSIVIDEFDWVYSNSESDLPIYAGLVILGNLDQTSEKLVVVLRHNPVDVNNTYDTEYYDAICYLDLYKVESDGQMILLDSTYFFDMYGWESTIEILPGVKSSLFEARRINIQVIKTVTENGIDIAAYAHTDRGDVINRLLPSNFDYPFTGGFTARLSCHLSIGDWGWTSPYGYVGLYTKNVGSVIFDYFKGESVSLGAGDWMKLVGGKSWVGRDSLILNGLVETKTLREYEDATYQLEFQTYVNRSNSLPSMQEFYINWLGKNGQWYKAGELNIVNGKFSTEKYYIPASLEGLYQERGYFPQGHISEVNVLEGHTYGIEYKVNKENRLVVYVWDATSDARSQAPLFFHDYGVLGTLDWFGNLIKPEKVKLSINAYCSLLRIDYISDGGYHEDYLYETRDYGMVGSGNIGYTLKGESSKSLFLDDYKMERTLFLTNSSNFNYEMNTAFLFEGEGTLDINLYELTNNTNKPFSLQISLNQFTFNGISQTINLYKVQWYYLQISNVGTLATATLSYLNSKEEVVSVEFNTSIYSWTLNTEFKLSVETINTIVCIDSLSFTDVIYNSFDNTKELDEWIFIDRGSPSPSPVLKDSYKSLVGYLTLYVNTLYSNAIISVYVDGSLIGSKEITHFISASTFHAVHIELTGVDISEVHEYVVYSDSIIKLDKIGLTKPLSANIYGLVNSTDTLSPIPHVGNAYWDDFSGITTPEDGHYILLNGQNFTSFTMPNSYSNSQILEFFYKSIENFKFQIQFNAWGTAQNGIEQKTFLLSLTLVFSSDIQEFTVQGSVNYQSEEISVTAFNPLELTDDWKRQSFNFGSFISLLANKSTFTEEDLGKEQFLIPSNVGDVPVTIQSDLTWTIDYGSVFLSEFTLSSSSYSVFPRLNERSSLLTANAKWFEVETDANGFANLNKLLNIEKEQSASTALSYTILTEGESYGILTLEVTQPTVVSVTGKIYEITSVSHDSPLKFSLPIHVRDPETSVIIYTYQHGSTNNPNWLLKSYVVMEGYFDVKGITLNNQLTENSYYVDDWIISTPSQYFFEYTNPDPLNDNEIHMLPLFEYLTNSMPQDGETIYNEATGEEVRFQRVSATDDGFVYYNDEFETLDYNSISSETEVLYITNIYLGRPLRGGESFILSCDIPYEKLDYVIFDNKPLLLPEWYFNSSYRNPALIGNTFSFEWTFEGTPANSFFDSFKFNQMGIHRLIFVLNTGDETNYEFNFGLNITNSIDIVKAVAGATQYKDKLYDSLWQKRYFIDFIRYNGQSIPYHSSVDIARRSYSGKDVLESQLFYDGYCFHTLRSLWVGFSRYNLQSTYGWGVWAYVYDQGTYHEKQDLVVRKITFETNVEPCAVEEVQSALRTYNLRSSSLSAGKQFSYNSYRVSQFSLNNTLNMLITNYKSSILKLKEYIFVDLNQTIANNKVVKLKLLFNNSSKVIFTPNSNSFSIYSNNSIKINSYTFSGLRQATFYLQDGTRYIVNYYYKQLLIEQSNGRLIHLSLAKAQVNFALPTENYYISGNTSFILHQPDSTPGNERSLTQSNEEEMETEGFWADVWCGIKTLGKSIVDFGKTVKTNWEEGTFWEKLDLAIYAIILGAAVIVGLIILAISLISSSIANLLILPTVMLFSSATIYQFVNDQNGEASILSLTYDSITHRDEEKLEDFFGNETTKDDPARNALKDGKVKDKHLKKDAIKFFKNLVRAFVTANFGGDGYGYIGNWIYFKLRFYFLMAWAITVGGMNGIINVPLELDPTSEVEHALHLDYLTDGWENTPTNGFVNPFFSLLLALSSGWQVKSNQELQEIINDPSFAQKFVDYYSLELLNTQAAYCNYTHAFELDKDFVHLGYNGIPTASVWANDSLTHKKASIVVYDMAWDDDEVVENNYYMTLLPMMMLPMRVAKGYTFGIGVPITIPAGVSESTALAVLELFLATKPWMALYQDVRDFFSCPDFFWRWLAASQIPMDISSIVTCTPNPQTQVVKTSKRYSSKTIKEIEDGLNNRIGVSKLKRIGEIIKEPIEKAANVLQKSTKDGTGSIAAIMLALGSKFLEWTVFIPWKIYTIMMRSFANIIISVLLIILKTISWLTYRKGSKYLLLTENSNAIKIARSSEAELNFLIQTGSNHFKVAQSFAAHFWINNLLTYLYSLDVVQMASFWHQSGLDTDVIPNSKLNFAKMFSLLGSPDIFQHEKLTAKQDEFIKPKEIAQEYDKFNDEIALKISQGHRTIFNDDVANKVQFINMNLETGRYKLNPEFTDIIDKLTSGETILIAERQPDGTYSEREVGLNDFFGNRVSNTISQYMLISLKKRMQTQVDKLNQQVDRFYENEGITYAKLTDERKEETKRELALWLYTEVTKGQIFGEDFAEKAALFYKDADKLDPDIEEISKIMSFGLERVLKGELAILMIWIHSLLLMKADSKYNDVKYQELLTQFRMSMNVWKSSSVRGMKIVTDYYNPFIRYIFSVDSQGGVDVIGTKYVSPEQILYKDNAISKELPFDVNSIDSIFNAIKELWNDPKQSKKPKGFDNVDINSITVQELIGIIKEKYNVPLDSTVALLMLYYHSQKYSNIEINKFLNEIIDYFGGIPHNDIDELLFLISGSIIRNFNLGKDFFGDIKYILLEPYKDGDENKYKAIPIDGNGNYIREGYSEFEAKSGWDGRPKAVNYGGQSTYFTCNPTTRSKMMYVTYEEIATIAENFVNAKYDLSIEKSNGGKLLLNKKNRERYTVQDVIDILQNAKRFSIETTMPDRIDQLTAVSSGKHLLRRLIDIVEKYPELQTNSQWKQWLTGENPTTGKEISTSERHQYLYLFLSHVFNNIAGDWYGLDVHKTVSITDSYGNTRQVPIIKEIVSEYFSNIVYYNILLFASGQPIYEVIDSLVSNNVYIPKVLSVEKIDDTFIVSELPNAAPSYKNPFNCPISALVKSTMDLQLKISVQTETQRVTEAVVLSHKSFTPITILKQDSSGSTFSMRVMALQIIDEGVEKIIYLDGSGQMKTKAIGDDNCVTLSSSEKIYGAVKLADYSNKYVELEAKHVLTSLLIYGGFQFNGLKFEAIADIFNKQSVDPYTNEEKKIPFLQFLILSFGDESEEKQTMSLSDPVLKMMIKGHSDSSYTNRPRIEGVAGYIIDTIIGCDLGWLFDLKSKYSDAYYHGVVRDDKYARLTNRQRIISDLNQLFLMKLLTNTKFKENIDVNGADIRETIYNYFVKKITISSIPCVEDVSREKVDDTYIQAKISIPDIFRIKTNTKEDTAIVTRAKLNRFRLLYQNPSTLTTNEIKNREKYCINLIYLVENLKGSLPAKIETSTTWKTITEILSEYYTVHDGNINYKDTQISPEDLVKITLLLFPELLQATKLEPFPKKITNNVNYEKLKSTNPDPNEFLNLLPVKTLVLREPYVQFMNFLGYLICTEHSVYYKRSTGTWWKLKWPDQTPSLVPDIALNLARNWIPWLILRSENFEAWLTSYKRLDLDMYSSEGIMNLIEAGHLPAEIQRILDFSLDDIREGKYIENIDENKHEEVTISYYEKLLWLFIMQSRYSDTATYNLHRYLKAINDIKKLLELGDYAKTPAEKLEELIGLLKLAFF